MTGVADCRIVLVLAGGNALGAYQAGVYQALHAGGLSLDWIVGTSIGAANGAIVAGNAPEDRLEALRAFWRPDGGAGSLYYSESVETWRRSGEALSTLLAGRAGMFAPVGTGLATGSAPGLYDTTPLARTLARLIDFDRLNEGPVRYTAQAVSLDTGHERLFDTQAERIGEDHIRASGAMPPAFPPIAIDGVCYVDGGLAANLPLDPVLGEADERPLLCIAVDLLPLAGGHDPTLGSLIARTQDLTFAAQSHRTLARWQDRYTTDPGFHDRAVALVQLTYAGQHCEVAGKAMDFSAASVRQRWDAGERDGAALLAALRGGGVPLGRAGLNLVAIPQGDAS
ncbi:patatin-like phospholipase family protein [Sphingomonas sanguinis]|uniref:Patatin-like phospholipase family protein n=1 Tax=Sphingomonas sanguinis TaxID=33051 RepID=A0ABU5LPT8_9SPHN|nr:patatin-like phospholipase family protein [Sphingomonas sanguinis]MDZ7281943.1 patatin-like phospholipase family protein [Sphingomonas sanguinis]